MLMVVLVPAPNFIILHYSQMLLVCAKPGCDDVYLAITQRSQRKRTQMLHNISTPQLLQSWRNALHLNGSVGVRYSQALAGGAL